jgi:hypothetical protein
VAGQIRQVSRSEKDEEVVDVKGRREGDRGNGGRRGGRRGEALNRVGS